ncbi:nicotinate-nucleotide--dimethylbenzimidazole phosphoribosyltransferase [uncultured Ferrovibrio sp.]|jgi:nicotinate-nucleotide--dimethylbenzimidazole phosphoribosyltransferase|uniref:nicotinate-nucleotide--dimethylbenzimidazole phosphoribosyltransferase n=1 Tax=uncultured Ferrovibrio sp. TaxID=1576913 RepID=UPI002635E2A2|nr:nicotinate-nucleotide--dimethylbenzimidazole phosphoribosyltransferase [uncultured Ferrovibrio sp.]
MAIVFSSFAAIRNATAQLPDVAQAAIAEARARDAELTKPLGSLARLEECVLHLAGWQKRPRPRLDQTHILIFAGNHGVTARGVSAFPAEVTAQMVANFQNGGAAINQLARLHGAQLSVSSLDLDKPTKDFTTAPAMSEAECLAAVNAGAAAVPEASDLVLIGEMGIGNTTAAAALAAALFGGNARDWVGSGTGVHGSALENKIAVVDAALAFHGKALTDPLEALRCVGGRELAALFGATLAARLRSIPVLLDGFVTGAAAAVLARLAPDGLKHCLAAHVSAEPGHRRLLEHLGHRPLLDLGMRLGEGSGAAVALGTLKAAVACHEGMATFAEAQVSNKAG